MGREIRRVPLDWEHPKNERGHFIPMYDKSHAAVVAAWTDGLVAWNRGDEILPDGTPLAAAKAVAESWEEWEGGMPSPEWYRPEFTSDPVGYQIYENVTEGTPISPVFATQDEMIVWLVNQGHSWETSQKFAELGFSFSMMIAKSKDGDVRIATGIDSVSML